MKSCTFCHIVKPLSEFHKDKNSHHTVTYRCKSCISELRKLWRIDNKEQIRAENKRRNPGWDIDRYNEYVKLQGNRCAICGTNEPGLSDWCCDHCHIENKARGLLCVKCNAGLGYFKDNPEFLQFAIDYLKKWQ